MNVLPTYTLNFDNGVVTDNSEPAGYQATGILLPYTHARVCAPMHAHMHACANTHTHTHTHTHTS